MRTHQTPRDIEFRALSAISSIAKATSEALVRIGKNESKIDVYDLTGAMDAINLLTLIIPECVAEAESAAAQKR